MRSTQLFNKSNFWNILLIVVIACSVVARLAAAMYLGNSVEHLPGTTDQLSYHHLAVRLINGQGFTFGEDWWPATRAGEPTAHWSFLYTYFLAGVYLLFGTQPLIARLIQALLVGILQPYLAYRIGRSIFGVPAGVVAAGLTGFYAYFIYYSAALMTEPFYITAVLLSLFLAMEFAGRADPEKPDDGRRGSVYQLIIPFGLTLGAAVLLRQIFLLTIPFIFLWIWWIGKRKSILPLFLSGAIVVTMILPFTVYNYLRFDRLVLLNTNAGFAFFWGNHPVYGTRFESILPEELGNYMILIPKELFSLDEAALDQELLKRGVGFVLDDPKRYILLSLSRIPAFFTFLPTADSSFISNVSRILSFGLTWPFMLYGQLRVLTTAFRSRDRRAFRMTVLLSLFALVYTTIHLLTWALIRYRLPVDAVMLSFAGFALVDLGGALVLRQKRGHAARLSR